LSRSSLKLTFAVAAALSFGGCADPAADPVPDAGGSDVDTDTDSDSDSDADSDPDPNCDNDGDGLSNGEEEELGTDPNDKDSDDDGFSDFLEWFAGTDPNDPDSNPVAQGDFYFYYGGYEVEPMPESEILVFTTEAAVAELAVSVRDDETDGEDATALIERVSPNTEGGIEDPLNPGVFCAGGLATADDDSDSIPDRFVDLPADTTVCFDVVAAFNSTITPQTNPKHYYYRAYLEVIADADPVVDTREVYFLVFPSLFL
jgi:hypothetical protein